MSLMDILCLFAIAVGTVLLLYGANYYDAIIGWSGTLIIICGFSINGIFRAYKGIKRRRSKLATSNIG